MNPQRTKARKELMKKMGARLKGRTLSPLRPGNRNRAEKPCAVCFKPMLAAPGEKAKYHKSCRVKRIKGKLALT